MATKGGNRGWAVWGEVWARYSEQSDRGVCAPPGTLSASRERGKRSRAQCHAREACDANNDVTGSINSGMGERG